MSADPAPAGPRDASANDEQIDADLLAAAEALADGSWLPAHVPGSARSACLTELQIIRGVQRVYRVTSPEADSTADGLPWSAESSASLGEALSRALPTTKRRDLSAARRWGPLFVLERVGSGSFGEVHRAWDPALDREVALKIVRVSDTAGHASAVVREGQLLAQVRHDNVISVYGAAQTDGEVGIWMEFVRGRTLEQIVREDGPMSAQEATVVAQSLCSALAAVHARGLLHRDIKAANVMRAEGGRYVLIDFGTGLDVNVESSLNSRLAGTPLYMAPEVLEGQRASVRSEIYSLGVLLFFTVTGSFPLFGRTLADIKAAHRSRRYVELADVRFGLPASFSAAVSQAVAPVPSRRFASAMALLDVLQSSTDARSPVRPFVSSPAVVGLAVGTAGIWLLGVVASLAFNVAFGRVQAFSTDPLQSYWFMGLRALVAPAAYCVCVLLVILVARTVVRGVNALRGRTDDGRLGPPARMRRTWNSLLRQRQLQDCVLIVQVFVGVAFLFAFRRFLTAVTSYVADSDPIVFTPFRPENWLERNAYGILMTMAVAGFASFWSMCWIAQARARSSHSPSTVLGLVATSVMLTLLVMPYRITWQNKRERATYGGARCYIVDATPPDVLLYCPYREPPKLRTVSSNDRQLERHGITDSIFSDWSRGSD